MRVEGKRNEALPCFLREPKADGNKPAPGLPPPQKKKTQIKQNKKNRGESKQSFHENGKPEVFWRTAKSGGGARC